MTLGLGGGPGGSASIRHRPPCPSLATSVPWERTQFHPVLTAGTRVELGIEHGSEGHGSRHEDCFCTFKSKIVIISLNQHPYHPVCEMRLRGAG